MTNRLPTYVSRRVELEDEEYSDSTADESFVSKINERAVSLVRDHTAISIAIGIALGATVGWLVKRK